MFQQESYSRLKTYLAIDPLRLDEALMQTPSILQEVAENTADALQIRDAAKNDLEVATSRAKDQIRIALTDNGKAPSEQKVDSMVPSHSQVIQYTSAYESAKRDALLWQFLVDHMKEKSSTLRRIAELITSGYMSANSAYTQRRDEINELRQRASEPEPEGQRFRKRGSR